MAQKLGIRYNLLRTRPAVLTSEWGSARSLRESCKSRPTPGTHLLSSLMGAFWKMARVLRSTKPRPRTITNCLRIKDMRLLNFVTGASCSRVKVSLRTNHRLLTITNCLPIKELRRLSSVTAGFCSRVKVLGLTNLRQPTITNCLPIKGMRMLSWSMASTWRLVRYWD
jgi:hypothetical protein